MPHPYAHCTLCPRNCGVDRTAGQTGVCRETDVCRVSSACAHFGEEPVLSGTRGSGTIFFAGCSCRCFFCQNHQISLQNMGEKTTPKELLRMAEGLIAQGVHNLNFVTPDHVRPHIVSLCCELRKRGHELPFVYNCSGYMTPETVDELNGVVDIYLPDFKFAVPELADECMHGPRYPELALASLTRMVESKGFLEPWDPTGRDVARTGVLVRHLVLPGNVENSLAVLGLLRREFGRMLPLSVMSQYRPMPNCTGHGAFLRPVRADEYDTVCDRVDELGFLQVFLQPRLHDSGFVPDFEHPDDPFDGNRRFRR